MSTHPDRPLPSGGYMGHERSSGFTSSEYVPGRRWGGTMTSGDIYANASLRENARTEIAVLLAQAHPVMGVPNVVGAYYAVLPLEQAPSPIFGRTGPAGLLYKGVSTERGTAAGLLRIVGPPPVPSAQIIRAGEAWKRVRHPAILCLKEVFTTRVFASPSAGIVPVNEIIFAYEFSSRADSVYSIFLNPSSADHRFHPLGEPTLWAFATQLLSAVAVVHANRLALRDALNVHRIMVTGRNRVRISHVGLSDAYDRNGVDHIPTTGQNRMTTNQDRIVSLQKADLISIGHFLATLALRIKSNLVRGGALLCADSVAVDAIARYTPYSEDFTMLIRTLLSAGIPSSTVTINQILGMVGPRLALELGHVWTHSDALERNLNVEFDSSRMFRLIGLLGFVNERSDAGVEPQWSETGDRYLLKLFRDYVFHRVDANGNPELNFAHVVECLSRLDVGSPEQILLSSRDGTVLLVASYEELRRCLIQSVESLKGGQNGLPNR